MEQFLYADSTEAFSYNTQIEESQVADFVKNTAPILKDTTYEDGLVTYHLGKVLEVIRGKENK